jgi:hypothetical protein
MSWVWRERRAWEEGVEGERRILFKITIAREFIFRSKCTKKLWRPGSARTRRRSLWME